jgi:SAM-dependent methyltransferase
LILYTLRNALDYPLRQFFRWRRAGLRLRNEPKDNLFTHLPPDQRASAQATADRLQARYSLDYLRAHSTARNFRENLFYLELLERALDSTDLTGRVKLRFAQDLSGLRAADIGPSHWFYVHALYGLWQWWGGAQREVTLTAYEGDAFRVYHDLHSRWDHAQAHKQGLPEDRVRYEPHAFTRQPATFDAVTMLFPFVFIKDHLEWGLPRGAFDPAQLLAEAWSSLKPGGVLILVNQGEAEHAAQRQMLEQQSIPVSAAFRHDSLLFQYDPPRFVLVAVCS